MKSPVVLLLILVLSLAVTSLHAAEKAVTASEPSRLPAASVGHLTIKHLELNDIRLTEAIGYLRQEYPGFQAVIVSGGDRLLPSMTLENLPLSQVLEVIGRTLPDLKVDRVSSDKGEVWIFQSKPTDDTKRRAIQVYRLAPLIRANVADRSKALSNALSLVQAALQELDHKEPYTMKFHDATETLIFKGSPVQIEVVNRALKALEPTPAEVEPNKVEKEAPAPGKS